MLTQSEPRVNTSTAKVKSPNSLASLFINFNADFEDLSPETQSFCQLQVLKYLFNKIPSHTLINTTLLNTGLATRFNDCINFKTALVDNGYIIKDLKLSLWRYFYYEDPADLVKLKNADKDLIGLLSDPELNEHLVSLKAKNFKSITIDNFYKHLQVSYSELMPWVRGWTNKHCAWILSSFSLDVHDLSMELYMRAYHSACLMFPRINSHDHMLNIMRLTIRNYTANIQIKYSSDSRYPMIKTESVVNNTPITVFGDGFSMFVEAKQSVTHSFESVVVSANAVRVDDSDPGFDAALAIFGAESSDPGEDIKLQTSNQLTRLAAAIDRFGDVYEYPTLTSSIVLSLFNGELPEDFQTHLLKRIKSVDSYLDSSAHNMLKQYCTFIGVTKPHYTEMLDYFKRVHGNI